jgi:SAM-dependent methyltransferase
MTEVRERWRRDRLPAISYDAIVERERLARLFGRLIWGADTRRLFREIGRLGSEPAGSKILDVPCGGGVAFRGLRPDQDVRYVAADLSPVMLERARREASRRGLEQIEFAEADVESLPFEDASFDLCVTYNSIHCFPDPPAAIAEMARVIGLGGALRGTTAVKGTGRRQDAFIRLNQRAGTFGPGGTADDLKRWLREAGLVEAEIERDGGLAYLSARRPHGPGQT